MLTLNQIRTQVAAIRDAAEGAQAFGLQVQQAWSGPDQVTVDDVGHRIVQAGSELAFREALVESGRTGIPVILLTPLAEGALGEDVLARLARRRLYPLSGREMLRQLFGAKDVEPRLRNRRWMAEALVEAQPSGGYPPVPTGRLDEETAWEMLLRHVLGFRGGRPDLVELLAWSRQPEASRRLGALPSEAASDVETWLTRSAGGAAGLVLGAVRAVHTVSPVALSLACSVLFARSDSTELIAARGRVEQYFGGRSPTEAEGRQLAEAARKWVETEETSEALRHEGEGLDQLLKHLRVDGYARASDFSPMGFEQRVRGYAEGLLAYLGDPGGPALARLESSFQDVGRHLSSRRDPDRFRRAGMALRLVRWLHQRKPVVSFGLAAIAAGYYREGSFVDWARIALYHGDSESILTKAYSDLIRAVGNLREEGNRRFAEALLEAGAGATSGLPGVEDVIPGFVVPLAGKRRMLLLVVDGMSLAVFRELMETVSRMGFVELVQGEATESAFGLAGLPTITEWSRRLLLGGRDQSVGSQGESLIFREHPALAGFTGTKSPMLFLKGDLTQAGDVGLSLEVRRQIDGKAAVIGAVVNAVDDHLAKGDQLQVPWTLERVPILHQLLVAAGDANRVVVLTSDHGHVVERDSETVRHDGGDRYRTDGGRLTDREMEVRGARVAPFVRGGFTAPWSERLIYTTRRNGYHGGLTPQEVLVPITVLAHDNSVPEGWNAVPQRPPPWWFESTPVVGGGEKPVDTPPLPAVLAGLPLFQPPAAPQVAGGRWLDALIGSEVFQNQHRMAGRVAPTQEVIGRVLTALDERGGTMLTAALAGRAGVAEFRLPGMLAGLRRVLNVEGYPVLTVDENSGTVRLDRELMETQFDLP